MSHPETIIRVRQLPNGQLEYEDWKGKVQTCAPSELGVHAQAILRDPELPTVEVVNPGATRVAEFYARAILPPELRHLAQPGVNAVQDLLRALQQRRRPGPATSAQRQPNPEPPPDPPRHPPRSAHRRGQRVA